MPAKIDKQYATARLSVKITPNMDQALREKAAKQGKTLSQFIRKILIRELDLENLKPGQN